MNHISSHSVWWRIHRKFHPKKVQTNPNPMGKNKIHHPNLTNLGNLIRFKHELFVKPLQKPQPVDLPDIYHVIGSQDWANPLMFISFNLWLFNNGHVSVYFKKYVRFQKFLRLWSHCFWQKATKDVRSYGMMRYFTQKSTCADGGFGRWFSMIFLFSGVMFKFHLNFQRCFPPNWRQSFKFTYTSLWWRYCISFLGKFNEVSSV